MQGCRRPAASARGVAAHPPHCVIPHASLRQHTAREDLAGTFARRLDREGKALWVFLDVQGVEATHNIAERAHRFGVLWRKRSQGPRREKGNRWVERVLS
jgi:hypothetical protein